MRCPKCHYISFDNGDRCRNCGYEFSLAVDAAPADLPIQTGEEASGPLADLQLSRSDGPGADGGRAAQVAAFDGRGPRPAHDPAGVRRPLAAPAMDLPLFSPHGPDDDRPLVTPPAVPRAPLAVRRGNPAAARPRPRADADPEEPPLALELPDVVTPPPVAPARHRDSGAADIRAAHAADSASASLIRRAIAGVIDAAIVLGIDAAIVYLTLRLCGLRADEIAVVPVVPFLTFVLLLNGGYFASFVAAGGQTIGKMATGIRVVPHPAERGTRVSFGFAVLRTAAYLVSVLPLGLGLLPALFSGDRRTLHDRLAETRVVRNPRPDLR